MRALISVSDKTGVVEFAGRLVAAGWEILSTSGTMKLLREAGLPVTSVSDVTGFPEICDGRVKTLHPKIHGALLARRDVPAHMQALQENGIEKIDLVCVNLYPFRETIAKPDVTMEDAVEHIDIGGPSMLRSAAKNWESVTVVVNPSDYATVLQEIETTGNTTRETRLALSAKAYTHTAEYDMAISTHMRAQAGLPEKLFLAFDEKQPLRYGENPHQNAKFFRGPVAVPYSLATARQLNGKELSYNNIQDANALRPVDFVPGYGKKIYLHFLNINWNLSKSLNRIYHKIRALVTFLNRFSYSLQVLLYTNLVINCHDRYQDGIFPDETS